MDFAAQLPAPVLGHYGGKDQDIGLDSLEKMRGALNGGKTRSEVVVYPEA